MSLLMLNGELSRIPCHTQKFLQPSSATLFFYAESIVFATNLLGPPVSSLLMDRNLWLPMNIGLVITASSFFIVLALPETMRVSKKSQNAPDVGVDITKNTQTPYADFPSSEYQPQPQTPRFGKRNTPNTPFDFSSWILHTRATVVSRSTVLLSSLLAASRFLFQDWRVPFLIVAASAHTIAETSAGNLLQYVPKRYDWTISQTNYLFSLRAAVSIVTLLFLLPKASKWLMERKQRTSFSKDVLLCRVSFAFVATGVLIDGLAPVISVLMLGLFVHTLGSGTVALLPSLMAGLVQPTEVARLFTVMSLVQTVSVLVASPVMASLYRRGLRMGGGWVGLPFLVGGALFAVATGAIWALRLDRSKVKSGGVEVGSTEEDTALILLDEE